MFDMTEQLVDDMKNYIYVAPRHICHSTFIFYFSKGFSESESKMPSSIRETSCLKCWITRDYYSASKETFWEWIEDQVLVRSRSEMRTRKYRTETKRTPSVSTSEEDRQQSAERNCLSINVCLKPPTISNLQFSSECGNERTLYSHEQLWKTSFVLPLAKRFLI